jgi:CelD/BcsL family acetyltransferase involved in cellulose biosynthesis
MTAFQLHKPADLTAADWALWQDIQERSGIYESPYFHPEFARAVAAVRSDVEIARVVQGEQTVGFFPFQRGSLNLGKPLGGKLSDYHGPLVRQNVEFDPRALLGACRLGSWDFDHLITATPSLAPLATSRQVSPQIDLSEGFEAYLRRRREAGSDTIQRQGQKQRKLAREVGPLAFEFDSPGDDEAYALLRQWKSAQFARTGLADVFGFPWTLALLEKLRAHRGPEFSAPLAVLRAGGQVAATCLSLRSRGVLHSWFVAYNPELERYSPGLSLFIELAKAAQDQGVRKIDLGKGSERYKTSLATGGVELAEGSIVSPSLATWLRSGWRGARDWVNRSPLKKTVQLPARLVRPLREWFAYH